MREDATPFSESFNTVNGKYCCNIQALFSLTMTLDGGFNTVNGKYCCNKLEHWMDDLNKLKACFNTVNGKYCCNMKIRISINLVFSFNTVNGKYCCNF